MRLGTLAFLFGILFCQTLSFLPVIPILFIFPLIVLTWKLSRYRLVFLFLLGLLWTVWRVEFILAQDLPLVLEGQDIIITGVIIGLPKQLFNKKKSYGWQFEFAPAPLQKWPNPRLITTTFLMKRGTESG